MIHDSVPSVQVLLDILATRLNFEPVPATHTDIDSDAYACKNYR